MLLGKVARNRLRRSRRIRRPNRFVRILRGFLALVHIRRRGQVPGSQLLADPLARPFDRLRRHARRIRSHVSNKAGCSLGAHLDAFIKPLRHAHRAAHIEAQLAGRVPLQLAGDERRLRPSLLLCGLHRSQRPLRLVERRNHRLHRLLIRQRIGNKLIFSVLVLACGHSRRLSVDAHKTRLELFLRLLFRMQLGVQRPVLHRSKRADLPLPLHDQPHGHGLHAPSREAPPNLIPKQRRNLVAHQPVQNAPRLLRVHEVLIQVPGMLECLLHRLLRNLVEGHPLNLFPLLGRRAQLQRQVVRNRLALAVRIGRKIDFVSPGRGLLQLRDDFLFARRHNQRRLEGAILQLHAQFVLGQVHDVPHRGQHFETRAKILLNRLGLGGRLDDHQ